MWRPVLVGAVAFTTAVISLASIMTTVRAGEQTGYVQQQRPRAGAFISNAQISRFKAALRLNAEQQRHWPAVAAVLRTMRSGNRAAAMATNAFSLRRLVRAATPLFRSLDDGQKQVALELVQSLGFGAFVAAL